MRSSPVRHAIPATTKGLALVGVASCLAMVASIAAVHGCGSLFIQWSKSKRVAGIVPSA